MYCEALRPLLSLFPTSPADSPEEDGVAGYGVFRRIRHCDADVAFHRGRHIQYPAAAAAFQVVVRPHRLIKVICAVANRDAQNCALFRQLVQNAVHRRPADGSVHVLRLQKDFLCRRVIGKPHQRFIDQLFLNSISASPHSVFSLLKLFTNKDYILFFENCKPFPAHFKKPSKKALPKQCFFMPVVQNAHSPSETTTLPARNSITLSAIAFWCQYPSP